MKNKLCDILYFIFLLLIYIFMRNYKEYDAAFELITASYTLFLHILNCFSLVMSTKGWERLF